MEIHLLVTLLVPKSEKSLRRIKVVIRSLGRIKIPAYFVQEQKLPYVPTLTILEGFPGDKKQSINIGASFGSNQMPHPRVDHTRCNSYLWSFEQLVCTLDLNSIAPKVREIKEVVDSLQVRGVSCVTAQLDCVGRLSLDFDGAISTWINNPSQNSLIRSPSSSITDTLMSAICLKFNHTETPLNSFGCTRTPQQEALLEIMNLMYAQEVTWSLALHLVVGQLEGKDEGRGITVDRFKFALSRYYMLKMEHLNAMSSMIMTPLIPIVKDSKNLKGFQKSIFNEHQKIRELCDWLTSLPQVDYSCLEVIKDSLKVSRPTLSEIFQSVSTIEWRRQKLRGHSHMDRNLQENGIRGVVPPLKRGKTSC